MSTKFKVGDKVVPLIEDPEEDRRKPDTQYIVTGFNENPYIGRFLIQLDGGAYYWSDWYQLAPTEQPEVVNSCTCDYKGSNAWLGCRCGYFEKVG